jgi:hypothetical protein
MTTPPTDQAQVQQNNEKELNFRKQEQMFQRQLAAERARADELERRFEESRRQVTQVPDDDDDTSEPYVDHKRLQKKLNAQGQQIKQETHTTMQQAIQQALAEDRKERWIKDNPDFYTTLQLADKFHEKHKNLAETILQMPEGFERQKLVYQNIKELGLDKPVVQQPSIQEKIDANRKGPYYQPSGMGTSPYSSQGDFSAGGQKQAYDKMQELKARLRI